MTATTEPTIVRLMHTKNGRPSLTAEEVVQRRLTRMRRILDNIARAETKIANQTMRITNWREELVRLEGCEK